MAVHSFTPTPTLPMPGAWPTFLGLAAAGLAPPFPLRLRPPLACLRTVRRSVPLGRRRRRRHGPGRVSRPADQGLERLRRPQHRRAGRLGGGRRLSFALALAVAVADADAERPRLGGRLGGGRGEEEKDGVDKGPPGRNAAGDSGGVQS